MAPDPEASGNMYLVRQQRIAREGSSVFVVVALAAFSLAGCGATDSPPREDSRIQIGLTLLRAGAVEEGLEQLRAASAEPGKAPSPEHVPAWLTPAVERLVQTRHPAEADSILALLGPVGSRPPDLQLLSASVAVLQGRETEAIGLYRSLRAHPELGTKAAHDLAMLHRLRGRHEQALEAARDGLEGDSGNEALRNLLIASLLDLDRPEEALTEAQSLPLGVSRRTFEGHALLALGEPDSAVVVLRQALRITPHSPRVRYLLGRAYVEAGDAVRAVRALEALAQPPSPYEDSQRVLARAYRQVGRTSAADSLEEEFAREDRLRRIDDLRMEGLLHSRDGDLEAARRAFEAAQALDPGNADLHNDLGTVLARLGRYAEAERELRRAAELRPHDPAVLRNLTRLYELTGETTKRAAALRELESLPRTPEEP